MLRITQLGTRMDVFPPQQVTTSTQGIVREINSCDPLCLTWIHSLIMRPMLGAPNYMHLIFTLLINLFPCIFISLP